MALAWFSVGILWPKHTNKLSYWDKGVSKIFFFFTEEGGFSCFFFVLATYLTSRTKILGVSGLFRNLLKTFFSFVNLCFVPKMLNKNKIFG